MEEIWAEAIRRGDKVSVRIEVDWRAGSNRPDGFLVEHTITDSKSGLQVMDDPYFPNK